MKVRLHRAVACSQWSSMCLDCKVSHIISSRSDHCPILINFLEDPKVGKITKNLRYESYWEREWLVLDDQVKSC